MILHITITIPLLTLAVSVSHCDFLLNPIKSVNSTVDVVICKQIFNACNIKGLLGINSVIWNVHYLHYAVLTVGALWLSAQYNPDPQKV